MEGLKERDEMEWTADRCGPAYRERWFVVIGREVHLRLLGDRWMMSALPPKAVA
jgi:hypothetical protein